MGRALLATSRTVSAAPSQAGDDEAPMFDDHDNHDGNTGRSRRRRAETDEGLAPKADEYEGEEDEEGSVYDNEEGNALASLTSSELAAHDRKSDVIERRQFHCATHGLFWKRVLERKPVAHCPGCGPNKPR